MNISHYKKGYTLLFAIVVSSIVLSIAAFILSVSRKQFILSSAARDSTVAVYAADSGIQCASEAYYSSYGLLATSSENFRARIPCNSGAGGRLYTGTYDLNATPDTDMNMAQGVVDGSGGSNFKVEKTSPITIVFPASTVFSGSPSPSCAIITITQGYDLAPPHSHKTIIDSRGYNIGNGWPCVSGGTTNPRAVERAIRLIYKD